MDKNKGPTLDDLEVLRMLAERLDLIAYSMQIGKRTRFGKRKHTTEEWHHTRIFLASYADPATTVDEVRGLFERLGLKSEVEAARYVALNERYIP